MSGENRGENGAHNYPVGWMRRVKDEGLPKVLQP